MDEHGNISSWISPGFFYGMSVYSYNLPTHPKAGRQEFHGMRNPSLAMFGVFDGDWCYISVYLYIYICVDVDSNHCFIFAAV